MKIDRRLRKTARGALAKLDASLGVSPVTIFESQHNEVHLADSPLLSEGEMRVVRYVLREVMR